MKFSQLEYKRPDIEVVRSNFKSLLVEFDLAKDAETQILVIDKINALRNDFETMLQIASVKYTLDTSNQFYQAEQDYFDEKSPVYQEFVSDYYRALVNSKFRKELESKYGKQLFTMAEMTLKSFSPAIIEDLQKENLLSSEYTKLLAEAKFMFDGKEQNLSTISPYISDSNREIRKEASKVKYDYMASIEPELDRLFDELVKVRTTIAKKLGLASFTELGYLRMLRSDYNAKMVADYREQIRKHIVPIVANLKIKQAKRLGLDTLKFYDDGLYYKTGNAKPQGDPDWIVANAKKMYHELAKETGEFFDYMINNEMMDLVARNNKATGGYCTFFNNYKAPFIFSNFNGTTHDVEVLTHEAGHAFQAYESKDFQIPEYYFPTYEACEIHSMSMEFITWPWMNLFFIQDTDKFKHSHLVKSIEFLPYGVAVDEFQHVVYDNPALTPVERKKAWRDIEKKYVPYRNYEGNSYLENGGFWHQQRHIYQSPFYYIDYTLAQICAFQFWKKSEKDLAAAMKDYIKLCKQGGSKSFLQLVEVANLTSPFSGGCLESVAGEVRDWLMNVDDSKL